MIEKFVVDILEQVTVAYVCVFLIGAFLGYMVRGLKAVVDERDRLRAELRDRRKGLR